MPETEQRNERYQCTNCGERFTPDEYRALDRQLMHPDADRPKRGGYENVCPECGAGIHSDQWTLREEVETDDGEFVVLTYGLTAAHGTNYDLWFETMIYHPWGDRMADRYSTKSGAHAGHERYVEQIRAGEYHREPSGWRLVLEAEDG